MFWFVWRLELFAWCWVIMAESSRSLAQTLGPGIRMFDAGPAVHRPKARRHVKEPSKVLILFLLSGFSLAFPQAAPDKSSGWSAVEAAIGRSGQAQADGAYKFGLPRGDMKVTVDGVQIKPTLALGSWVAFSNAGADAMMMGDLVLAEDEVAPVMARLQENGIDITALHNHVLYESPKVMYMHISGHGDAGKLATAVKQAVAPPKTSPPPSSLAPAAPPSIDIDTAAIEQALRHKGKVNPRVLQVGVPPPDTISQRGLNIPP